MEVTADRRGHTRRTLVRGLVVAAGGLALLPLAGMLRRRGHDPREVARRFGLRVVPLPADDPRGPHDLAG
ncbi:MAG: hypothetical protein QGH45_12950 [Myxococcota bacterium]|nr:hypothetical protein [Myxococcota bacterium]